MWITPAQPKPVRLQTPFHPPGVAPSAVSHSLLIELRKVVPIGDVAYCRSSSFFVFCFLWLRLDPTSATANTTSTRQLQPIDIHCKPGACLCVCVFVYVVVVVLPEAVMLDMMYKCPECEEFFPE